MSEWNFSIVFICKKEDQDNSNLIAEVLGYGPNTFSLPCGPEGSTEPTHYFNHSFGAQAFVDMVTNLSNGNPPEGLPTELLPALSNMIIDITNGGDPISHTDEVLQNNNLVKL